MQSVDCYHGRVCIIIIIIIIDRWNGFDWHMYVRCRLFHWVEIVGYTPFTPILYPAVSVRSVPDRVIHNKNCLEFDIALLRWRKRQKGHPHPIWAL